MSDPQQPNPMHDPNEPDQPRPLRSPEPTPAGQAARPRKRRWLRRTLWVAASLLVLLVILIALAPTLLSTGPGNRLAERIAGGQINGTIQLSGLSLGWFSGTSVESAIVEDEQARRVLDVANLETDLTLWNLLRQNFNVGDTTGRINLPLVLVYDDGTTNLHQVFGLVSDPADDQPTEIPDIAGDIRVDGSLNVQYVGNPTIPEDDSAPVDVDFAGTHLTLGPGKPLAHTLPLALRINGQPAGQIVATGTIDLATLSAERPTIKEEIQLTDLQLAALGTLLAPFGVQDYELAGVMNGALAADLAENTLGGTITGTDVSVSRRGVEGQGYDTSRLELVLAGQFIDEALPADQRVKLADGTTLERRQLVDVQNLALTTDDGTLTAGAKVDLMVVQTDPVANWPMLARDVTLDLKTDFATAHGEGQTLGAFALDATADMARMNEQFGNLLTVGGARPTEGTVRLALRTERAGDAGVNVPIDLNIENIVLVQAAASADAAPEATPAAAQVQGQQPGRISQPPPAAVPPAQPAQAPQPLRLGLVRLVAHATLPPPTANQPLGVGGVSADLTINDAESQPIVTGKFSASDLAAESGGAGRIALENLSLPDYARLRNTLAGWVDLPEPQETVEPITMSALASYDGEARVLKFTEPLRVLLGAEELATLTAEAQQPEEGVWVVPSLLASVNVPVLDQLAGKFGTQVGTRDPATGTIELSVSEDRPIRLSTADPAATLQGALLLAMEDAAARGMSITGTIPVELKGLTAAIPADAEPLTVNEGQVALAGTTVQQENKSWMLRLPQGQLVQNVSMNPVAMEALGKYINPVFVDPEQAAGLLDVKLAGADTVNLSDPFGSSSALELQFSIRQLRIDNDIIAQFAEAALGETVNNLRGQLSAIPGLDQQLQQFNLSEELKEDIASIRGNIMDAGVTLRDGVAHTRITFNVADPRLAVGEEGAAQLYPLSFTGGVNLETLAAVDLSVTIPTPLIEKWTGENPDDLVKYFGQRPWPKLLPDGVRLKISGTTYVPLPDPASLQVMAREVGTRAAKVAVQGGVEDALRRGLGDLLRPK